MCGIAGILGLEDKNTIQKMCDAIKHRGPDDEGYYFDDSLSLGHRRLSIIDLAGGHQPVHNEEQTVQIVFNGEIYNYRELKAELEPRHRFYTNTDTEVIVHCYEEYGDELVSRLNGMFAFALWDAARKKLLLARDPMGKKPLYYCIDGKRLVFASEIKSLFECGVKKAIDFREMSAFLAFGYSVGDGTLFQGIKKLPGGHILTVEKGDLKTLSIRKYWDIHEDIHNYTESYAVAKLRELLERSARYRLIADVPVGAFLSGGIDSSSVVALSRPLVDYPFHTFSIGFENFSEFSYARMISEKLDTEHHEIVLDSSTALANMDRIAWHYDEPLGDPAIIFNYFLSLEARKHVKVVLAGEAGDELFGGYPNYRVGTLFHSYFRVPGMVALMKSLISSPFADGKFSRAGPVKYLGYFAQPGLEQAHQYTYRAAIAMTDEEISYYSSLDRWDPSMLIQPEPMHDPLDRMLALDCKNMLPEKFLMKADKATMANSIEERLPLLDKGLIEFAFTIPPRYKLRHGNGKYILKEAVKDLLPAEVIARKKVGFGRVVDDWMFDGRLQEPVIQALSDNELVRKCFRKDRMAGLAGQIRKKERQNYNAIWLIYALSLWYDTYFN